MDERRHSRAVRRWFLRRAGLLLLPCALGAFLAFRFFSTDLLEEGIRWFFGFSAVVIFLVTAGGIAELLACRHGFRRSGDAAWRNRRRSLVMSPRFAAFSLLLAAVLAVLPSWIPVEPEERRSADLRSGDSICRNSAFVEGSEGRAAEPESGNEPKPDPPARPDSGPVVKPAKASPVDPRADPSSAGSSVGAAGRSAPPPSASNPGAARGISGAMMEGSWSADEPDPLAFLQEEEWLRKRLEEYEFGSDAEPASPALWLEVTTLDAQEDLGGLLTSLSLLLPLGEEEAVRLSYRLGLLYEDEIEGDPGLAAHLLSADYQWRLLGDRRTSGVDLIVRIGLLAALVASDLGGIDPDSALRIAPRVGVDLSVWEGRACGLVMSASRAFPTNLTGATEEETELSAFVRLRVFDDVTLRFGYRYLRIRLRDHPHSFSGGGSLSWDEDLTGLLVGLEFQF